MEIVASDGLAAGRTFKYVHTACAFTVLTGSSVRDDLPLSCLHCPMQELLWLSLQMVE